MAHTEDTELRDLVIEALEKNGSLAKIRALLRANIFLAFEDESETIKQNTVLSDILQLPEGVLSLSIIHEFLEFCNLKNTLFVYMSESRQGKEYSYEGRKLLAEKFNCIEQDNPKEPFLITLVKKILKSCQKKYLDRGDTSNANKLERNSDNNYKDDQNCTYIVHDDTSSATSNSNSDNSSDEKNKLHLKLHLDNSDTDTSSDSTRDRTCSEYIPNEHVSINTEMENIGKKNNKHNQTVNKVNQGQNIPESSYENDLKINNNSSDSTSYVELKPLKTTDQASLTDTNKNEKNDNNMSSGDISQESKFKTDFHDQLFNLSKVDPINLISSSNSSSVSLKSENENKKANASITHSPQESIKSISEVVDYSYDFSSSLASRNKEQNKQTLAEESADDNSKTNSKISPAGSPHHNNSHSLHSSVSISDVADLIEYSERNSPYSKRNLNETKSSHNDNSLSSSLNKSKASSKRYKPSHEDSGDFSDSPVPSLSNLSLDIHSD